MPNLGNFNAEMVDPLGTFEPVPNGTYTAVMTDSVFKTTKAGTGQYLECKWEIAEGQYKGRPLWSRLNLSNPNPKAVEIAQRELSSICHAVGKLHVADSVELHNIPISIKVVVTADTGYGPGNDIKGYEALGRTAPPQPQQQATPAQPQETKKPWER